MLLSVVAPLAGVPMSEVLKNLRRTTNDLSNLGFGSAAEVLEQYQRWSTTAAESLGYVIPSEDIDRLLLTQRHWVLLSMPVAGNGPVVHDMISAERTDRMRVLNAVIQELQALEARCAALPRMVVAADTNVFLHQEKYFDEVDWQALAGTSDRVRLLVPIAVVRELDKTKRAAKNITVSDTNKEEVRTRARVTSRKLREAFANPNCVVTLKSGVEAELLLDSPDHRPIEAADGEIIDRVLTAQSLSGHLMAIVTNDGGMQFAARTAGLEVYPLLEVN